jgi:predicted cobalt transporter CbtA
LKEARKKKWWTSTVLAYAICLILVKRRSNSILK